MWLSSALSLLIALVAGLLGFGGLNREAAQVAQLLFYLAILGFAVSAAIHVRQETTHHGEE